MFPKEVFERYVDLDFCEGKFAPCPRRSLRRLI